MNELAKTKSNPSLKELLIKWYIAYRKRKYKKRLKKAVKQAEEQYKLTRFHQLVFRLPKGEIMIMSRKKAKYLVKVKFFEEKNIEELEKAAYYSTR